MFKLNECNSCKNAMLSYDDIYFVCDKCRRAHLQSTDYISNLLDYLDQVSNRMQDDYCNLHDIQQKKLSALPLSEEEQKIADHCARFHQVAHDLKLMMKAGSNNQFSVRLYELIELKRESEGEKYYG